MAGLRLSEAEKLREENIGLKLMLAVVTDWLGGEVTIGEQELAAMQFTGRSLDLFSIEDRGEVVIRLRPIGS